jgi:hypothetical protein
MSTGYRPFVYALFDPADPSHVRYVGMAPSRASRPYEHAPRVRAHPEDGTHLAWWIRKLQAEGREPAVMILEELPEGTDRKFLGFIESCYIKSLRQIGHRLTNANDGGWGGSNGPHTPESIAKMKAGWTLEARAKVGAASRERETGKVHSAASRAKHSAAVKGVPKSPEHRAKIAAAATGRRLSPETKEKIGAKKRGVVGRSWSQESRDRSSATLTGRTHSEEWRAKNAAAHLGKKQSEETRARRSASLKATWARRKAEALTQSVTSVHMNGATQ